MSPACHVAGTRGCDLQQFVPCMSAGMPRGVFHATDDDKKTIRQVPRWRDSDRFTTLERQVLGYAEAMTVTPDEVTDEIADSVSYALMVLLGQLSPSERAALSAGNFSRRTDRRRPARGRRVVAS